MFNPNNKPRATNVEAYPVFRYGPTTVPPPPNTLPLTPVVHDDSAHGAMQYTAITPEQALDAFRKYIKGSFFLKKSFADNIVVNNVNSSTSLKFTVKVFEEERRWVYKDVPFTGQDVDDRDPRVHAWEFKESPKEAFKEEERVIEIPGASRIYQCPNCSACGECECDCAKEKPKPCRDCKQGSHCKTCNDTQVQPCRHCEDTKTIECPSCQGKKLVVRTKSLAVAWTNHTFTEVMSSKACAVPESKLASASGTDLLCETATLLDPRMPRLSPSESAVIFRLLEKANEHSNQNDKLLHLQRAKVVGVPVYECSFDGGSFFVYGLSRDIHENVVPYDKVKLFSIFASVILVMVLITALVLALS